MNDDSVREYLEQQQVSKHIIEGGLLGLVVSWERTVADAERGYDLEIEDWLNDLDGRQLLAEALAHASEEAVAGVAERVEAADARFRTATIESEKCLWGADNAGHYGWKPDSHWWYWRMVAER